MSSDVSTTFVPQVPADHYQPHSYDELHRWISYWYQIRAVIRTGGNDVLEIGLGSGVVAEYLRRRCGLHVVTFDADPVTQPDVIGDVRRASRAMGSSRFDVVTAFQVLEHLPFAEFPTVLEELAALSRSHVLLSLPYNGHFLQWRVRIWRWQVAFGRKIPHNNRWVFNGEHYWEIGAQGYPLYQVRAAITRVLHIEREYFCPDYPYHYFFECRTLRAR